MERRRRVRVPLERRPGDVQAGSRIVVVRVIVIVVVEVQRVVRRIAVQGRVHVRQLAARMTVYDQAHLRRRDRDGEARGHQRGEIASHGGRTTGRERATV